VAIYERVSREWLWTTETGSTSRRGSCRRRDERTVSTRIPVPQMRIVPVTNVISSADTCPPDYGSSAAANPDLKLAFVGEPTYKAGRITVPAEGELSRGLASGFQTRAVHRACLTTPHRRLLRIVIRGTRIIAPSFKPDLPTNLPKIQYARATSGDRQLWQTADNSSIRLLLGTLRAGARIVVVADGARVRHSERRSANAFIGKICRLL